MKYLRDYRVVVLILLHVFVLNFVFEAGYDMDARQEYLSSWKGGRMLENPIEYLRLFYSDAGDVESYWAFANIILGRHGFDYSDRIMKKYTIRYKNADGINVPYRDLSFEYPPLALPFILTPALFADTLDGYFRLFAIEATIFIFLSLIVGWKIISILGCRLTMERYLMCSLASIFLVGILFATRFDMMPAFFVVLALYLMLRERFVLSASSLAVGAMIKIYPAFILPFLAIMCLKRRDWGKMLATVAAFAAVVCAAMLPAFFVSGWEALSFLGYHSDRGIQVQSVYAACILLYSKIAHADVQFINNFGSFNIDAAGADAVARMTPYFQIALMASAYLFFLFKKHVKGDAVTAALLVITSFILACKVFSPQYMIWLFPLALMSDDRKQLLSFLLLCLIIQVEHKGAYPNIKYMYWSSVVIVAIKAASFLAFYLYIWGRAVASPGCGGRRL